MEVIAFNKVSDPFGWLGNMSRHPIEYEGITFPRCEHLFMWLRIKENFSSERRRIIETSNPISMKRMVKKWLQEKPEMLAHDFQSEKDLENMRMITMLKLEQYPEFKVQLLATGDKQIIEDVTTRSKFSDSSLFWGAAHLWKDSPNTKSQWVGLNHLGEIWMAHRSLIKKL